MAGKEPTTEISITLPDSYIEQLLEQYPVASRPQHAIRTALHNDMDRRTAAIDATIQESAVMRLQQSGGGTIENVQRISVGANGVVARDAQTSDAGE